MDKENIIILMEILMRENGWEIKNMEKGNIFITVLMKNMMVIGKKEKNMEKEIHIMLMVIFILEILRKMKEMDLV